MTTKRANFFQKLIDKVSRRIITQRILFILLCASKLLKTLSMTQNKIFTRAKYFTLVLPMNLFIIHARKYATYLPIAIFKKSKFRSHQHTHSSVLYHTALVQKNLNLGMTSRDTIRHLSSKSCLASSFPTYIYTFIK